MPLHTSHQAPKHLPFAEAINKVPEVTLVFWMIKILTTTVGETGADYLAVHVGLGTALTGGIMGAALLVALVAQLRSRRFLPWLYWLTVLLVSVVGTQITDALTDGLGVSLHVSSAFFALCLASLFYIWFAVERTLSIRSITSSRRELFYWGAVLFTFALGTATGDLATEALGLGFELGSVIFALAIAAVALGCRFGLDPVLGFWLAYILTRPLGASLGDWLSQARRYGGLGWGSSLTSLVFLAAIVALVVWTSGDSERGAQRQQDPT